MNLDDLLKLASRPPRIEAVPIGSGTMHVRGLSAGEVDEIAALAKDDEGGLLRCLIVAKALCNEKGEPLVGDVMPYAKQLAGLPEWTLKRLYLAVDRASDVEAGGTEALLGNSGERAGGGSTDSPSKLADSASSIPT